MSIDDAVKNAENGGWSGITAKQIDPESMRDQPRYDLGFEWAKHHKKMGNPLSDSYGVGGGQINQIG